MIDLKQYKNVTVLEHPLLKHKINNLRKVETSTKDFRTLVKEIAFIEAYEALSNVETYKKEICTPIEKTEEWFVDKNKLCFVPILRAGLGMADGVLDLIPGATCGHIGLYRDEVTHKPVTYYKKLPDDISERNVYLLDPMLATGGSAIGAIEILKAAGVNKLTFICIIAAPEGVKAVAEAHPDVPIYIGSVDRQLNSDAYICPGLGDCGDRIFGTVGHKKSK